MVKSCPAYFILMQRIERKSGRKIGTTRTKNINILFLRPRIKTTLTAKAGRIKIYWMNSILIGINFILEHNPHFLLCFDQNRKAPCPNGWGIWLRIRGFQVQILSGSLLFWFFSHINRLSQSYETTYHRWGVVMFTRVELLHLLFKSIERLSSILRLL